VDKKSQYNKFVEGTCKFDEKSAESSGKDDNKKRTVFSKPVDLSVDVMTWKIRMDELSYRNSYNKYFGIVKADESGQNVGRGYTWANYTSACQTLLEGTSQGTFGDRRLKQGDVLEVKFDQTNHRLEYSVNGKSQGVAFENLPSQKYKLGITLGIHNDKVTLLNE